MRKFNFLLIAFVTLALVTAMLVPPAPSTAQHESRAADEPPAPFNPQMGALMGMIIQPRHAKLGLAGKAENWPLAGYAFKELKQGFAVVSRAVPRWKGLPVPDLFEAAVTEPLTVLDFAIKAGEPRQFGEAYGRLTTACNACHATTDHPFIVIKAPDVSAWPNQDFAPKR